MIFFANFSVLSRYDFFGQIKCFKPMFFILFFGQKSLVAALSPTPLVENSTFFSSFFSNPPLTSLIHKQSSSSGLKGCEQFVEEQKKCRNAALE